MIRNRSDVTIDPRYDLGQVQIRPASENYPKSIFVRFHDKSLRMYGGAYRYPNDPSKGWEPLHNDKSMRELALSVLSVFYDDYGGIWTGCYNVFYHVDLFGSKYDPVLAYTVGDGMYKLFVEKQILDDSEQLKSHEISA